MIDGYKGFLFLDKKDMPEVALHWEKHFEWALVQIYDEPYKLLKTATFGRMERDVMAKSNLAEKDILNPSEAIQYFVLSRRKFYDLLKNTDGEDFLAYYGERKLIIRVAFEKYLLHHPELRRRV